MDNYNNLSELINSDSKCMEFYRTLTPSLQQSLLKKNPDTFLQLKECWEQTHRNSHSSGMYSYYNPSCSSNDCTGLIPAGANQTEDDFEVYKNLYPFEVPPSAKPLSQS